MNNQREIIQIVYIHSHANCLRKEVPWVKKKGSHLFKLFYE